VTGFDTGLAHAGVADAWLVAPVLVPLAAAMAVVLVRARPAWKRPIGLASVAAQLALAALFVRAAGSGTAIVHRPGDWPVPYGIVFVLDRLAAIMLLTTAVLALAALLHAVRSGEDREGGHFHALFQLQLAGLNGAFLTGDLFTLFVFFEVLLFASYGLLVHGVTPARLRWGVHYVTLNVVGSTLFLVAAGALYGLLGTLNLAALAGRAAVLPAAAAAPVHAAALLLLVVFALKAAVAPLHLWLPGTYAAAGTGVAALFAVMTKVGIYAVLRVFGVAFGPATGGALAGVAASWLFPGAVLTMLLGAAGALAASAAGARAARHLLGSLLVLSVGTLAGAVATLDAAGVGAGLYYLVHSTLAAGAMFLVVGQGRRDDEELPAGAVRGALFLVGAVALAGLPPLSGFVGKALILAAAPAGARGSWLWGAVLLSSFAAIVALARAGSALYWARSADDARPAGTLVPAAGLLAALVALTVFAGPASAYARAAAEQLLAPGGYAQAVLATPGGRR